MSSTMEPAFGLPMSDSFIMRVITSMSQQDVADLEGVFSSPASFPAVSVSPVAAAASASPASPAYPSMGDESEGGIALPSITSEDWTRVLQDVATAGQAHPGSGSSSSCSASASASTATATSAAACSASIFPDLLGAVPIAGAAEEDNDDSASSVVSFDMDQDIFNEIQFGLAAAGMRGSYSATSPSGASSPTPSNGTSFAGFDVAGAAASASASASSSHGQARPRAHNRRPGRKMALQFEEWPEDIVRLPLKQLNAYIKSNKLTPAMAKDLKRVRRRLQNKRAASDGRVRRAAERVTQGEVKNASVKETVRRLAVENANLEREVSRLLNIITTYCPEYALQATSAVQGQGIANPETQQQEAKFAPLL